MIKATLKFALLLACPFGLATTTRAFPLEDLSRFYFIFPWNPVVEAPVESPLGLTSKRPYFDVIPKVRLNGGIAPEWFQRHPADQYPAIAVLGFTWTYLTEAHNAAPSGYELYAYRDDVCGPSTKIHLSPKTGDVITSTQTWTGDGQAHEEPWSYCPWPMPGLGIETLDRLTFAPLIRRKTLDGGEYEASPLRLTRDGFAWRTHYFGYRLGPVASESNWSEANREAAQHLLQHFSVPDSKDNFELVSLPPPWVENEVTEYVNHADFPAQPDGHFFYAVRDDDKALLDNLPNWHRTGKSFLSGGYVSVCRFYGGLNGGPNTHFYSADAEECESLKQYTHLSYEGQTFATNLPMPPKNEEQAIPGALRDCPIDSKPLYRLYNAASSSSGRWVSNHRYTTDRDDVASFVQRGWIDEGHVMCVPV